MLHNIGVAEVAFVHMQQHREIAGTTVICGFSATVQLLLIMLMI
jgi:hypothetical protein